MLESLPHDRDPALRLPRLPRPQRAAAARGPRRQGAARAAGEGAGGVGVLPHLGRAPPPPGAGRGLSERLLAVGRHRGARRAPGRAARRDRRLPRRLHGSGARGADHHHLRPSPAPGRGAAPHSGQALPVLPDPPGAGAHRAPGPDPGRVPRRPRGGGRERALLPHHQGPLPGGPRPRRLRGVDRRGARARGPRRPAGPHRPARGQPGAHPRSSPERAERRDLRRGGRLMPGALVKIDDYRQVAPRGTVDFLMRIGERLRGKRLAHVSASRYGALAESLNRVVPILNDLGVETTWEITIGTADFDQVTRAIGKGLAGTEQVITDSMLARLRETGADNAQRLRLDADLVMVHDAAPLALVEGRGEASRWVWRCHHDLSAAQPQLWNALRPMVQRYDAAVFSLARFAAPLSIPRFIVYPSIDPLSERNREMTRSEQAVQLDRLRVPRDKPILLQVGPFERQHDPVGVINAYRLVKRHHDVRLVLAGPPPAPGGDALGDVQEAASHDPDISVIVLPPDPQVELNALERAATIAIQKPLKADFTIEVATAMWKGKPVIGTIAGGIPFQMVVNVTGYTVETVEGAAFRIRQLLSNPELIGRMGAAGREHVRRNFLVTRHLSDYLALLAHMTR